MGDWHFPFLSFLSVRSFVRSFLLQPSSRTVNSERDIRRATRGRWAQTFSSPARHATPRIRTHTSSTNTKFSSLFPELQIYTRRHAAVTDALATTTGTRLPWTEPHSLNQLAHFYPNTIPISNEELTLLRGRRCGQQQKQMTIILNPQLLKGGGEPRPQRRFRVGLNKEIGPE